MPTIRVFAKRGITEMVTTGRLGVNWIPADLLILAKPQQSVAAQTLAKSAVPALLVENISNTLMTQTNVFVIPVLESTSSLRSAQGSLRTTCANVQGTRTWLHLQVLTSTMLSGPSGENGLHA